MVKEHNPTIPDGSTQYFINARGVNYLPSLASEWEKSGNLPRVSTTEAALAWALAGSPSEGYGWSYNEGDTFVGANRSSIWHYYNEDDHDASLSKLRDLGINCIRVPLSWNSYMYSPAKVIANIKSFLSICEKHQVRVQFTIWNAELDLTTVYNPVTDVFAELTAVTTAYSDQLEMGLKVASLREPNPLQAQDSTFWTLSAVPFLDAVATAVKPYRAMWAFDLCNKPTPEYVDLSLQTQQRLDTTLSSTDIKYTFSPLAGVTTYEDTGYLDNGVGTGPSGSLFNTDIRTLSGVIDFVSIPFLSNNDYAAKRILNEAVSAAGPTSLYKPFMVYNTYDSTKLQNIDETLDLLQTSSVGYFSNMGVVDSPFSIGNVVSPGNNVFEDGQFRSLADANYTLAQGKSSNHFSTKQLRSSLSLVAKSTDAANTDDGYFSGTASIGSFDSALYVSANEAKWETQKWFYENHGDVALSRNPYAATTYLAPNGSTNGPTLELDLAGASSMHTNSTETNLGILYDFDTHFPAISSYTFATTGDNWKAINATMIYRNEFLQTLSKQVIDYEEVPYSELRNSVYDSNPIPDYERGILTELLEEITDSDQLARNPTTNTNSTTSPPSLTGTATYTYASAVYGIADSGTDFSTYYDAYYAKVVTQLKKCLMWLYWKGDTNPNFVIASDTFISGTAGFTASSLSSVEIYDGVAEAPSLTAVQSPLYTVEIFNPSTSTFDDSFVFVVSGQERQITSNQVDDVNFSGYWAVNGSRPPISFTTVGLSGMSMARISIPSNDSEDATPLSVTSVNSYPKRFSKHRQATITTIPAAGGLNEHTVADVPIFIGDKVYMEVNTVASAPLLVFADPYKPAIPDLSEDGDMATYAGQTRASYADTRFENATMVSGLTAAYTVAWDEGYDGALFSSLPGNMYFPAGVHNVSGGFPIGPSSTYYLDANAYLIGTFDAVSGYDSEFVGRGIISSEQYPRSFILDLKNNINSQAASLYAGIGMSVSSQWGSHWGNQHDTIGLTIDGIVLTNAGYFTNERTVIKSVNNCKTISPWTYNSDGWKVMPQRLHEMCKVTNTIALCGDDTLNPFGVNWQGPTYVRNFFSVPYRSAVVAAYYGGGLDHKVVIKDVDVLAYQFSGHAPASQADITRFEGGGLVTIYNDYDDDKTYRTGLANIDLHNWDIHTGGASALRFPMFHLANQMYVFNAAAYARHDGAGSLSSISLSHFNITPSAATLNNIATCSTIYGLSAQAVPNQVTAGVYVYNAPANIDFSNFKIGSDTFLTDENRDDWIAWINPASATISVTDPDSARGANSNITFGTT